MLTTVICAAMAVGLGTEPTRTLRHEAVIQAPIAEVWDAFATEEGIEAWMVPNASLDLRVGGELRTSYLPESDLHDEHTIVQQILSYEPQRLLSYRLTQRPADTPDSFELLKQTWSTIRFEPVGTGTTRVVVSGMGYGEGEGWDELWSFFDKGNQWTLDQLRKHLESVPGEQTNADAMALARRFVGTWVYEDTTGATPPLRAARVEMETGLDGSFLVGRGFTDTGGGLVDHGRTVIGISPESRRAWFWSFGEHGAVAQGAITAADDGATLEWDWVHAMPDGTSHRYFVRTTLIDAGHYRFRLYAEPPGEGPDAPVVNFVYTREGADGP